MRADGQTREHFERGIFGIEDNPCELPLVFAGGFLMFSDGATPLSRHSGGLVAEPSCIAPWSLGGHGSRGANHSADAVEVEGEFLPLALAGADREGAEVEGDVLEAAHFGDIAWVAFY
jgi:hypothetical protein